MNLPNLGPTKALGYNFSGNKLRYKDNRIVKEGAVHKAKGAKGQTLTKITGRVCNAGMHASDTPHNAYGCSPFWSGNPPVFVSLVYVEGIKDKKQDFNKFVGYKRTYLRCVPVSYGDNLQLQNLKGNSEAFNNFVYSLFK